MWTVHFFNRRLNREAVSRPFSLKDDALRHACDLMQKSHSIIHYVQGSDGERLTAAAVVAWRKGGRRKKPTVPE
jgi:hypothetical protein